MEKSSTVIKFGEDVEGYGVPVLNEREVRAAAGIMFVALAISLVLILFKQDFTLVKYVIIIFLTDFIIRVLQHAGSQYKNFPFYRELLHVEL